MFAREPNGFRGAGAFGNDFKIGFDAQRADDTFPKKGMVINDDDLNFSLMPIGFPCPSLTAAAPRRAYPVPACR